MSVTLRPDDLVLVTGGSGFLGSAVVRALIARGSRVRAIVRSSSPPDNLLGLGCEIVTGDLTDRESLAAALRGVRYLFHVAADYRFWARDPSVILRVNVEGTSSLMQEALSAGVERIVYTSSVAALKGGGRHEPGRRDGAAAVGRGDRRLQAEQDLGGAGGRGNDRARQAARHHRQSDDADRSARHPADADRTHPSRCGARQDPGLRGHRAELRACRRHRGGSPSCLRTRSDRRTLHPGRRERLAAGLAWRLPPSPAVAHRASACRGCRFTPWRSVPRRSRA